MAVPAEALSFEILVSDALAAAEPLARLMIPLRAVGCSFSLCESTGDQVDLELAASLGISFIKIDSSMVSGISGDPQIKARVDAITRRCRTLGMRTIFTQVEDRQDARASAQHSGRFVQGFGIDRPRLLEPFATGNE